MKIYSQNPPIVDNPNTNLSAASAVGASSLSVYNNAGFSATTNLVLLGQYGDEQAEVVKTSATTATSFTVNGVTTYAHSQDTLVSLMLYDQVEFGRSDDSGVTWQVQTTVNLQVDRNATVFVDTGGGSNSLWRYRFINTITGLGSSYSASIGASGYAFYQLAKMWDRVIALAQDPNMKILSFDDITDWLNECAEDLSNELHMADNASLVTFTKAALNASTLTLPDDTNHVKLFRLSYNGTDYYKATAIDTESDSSLDGLESTAIAQFSQTDPVYFRRDATLYFYPSNTSGSVPATNPTNYELLYFRLPTYLVNPNDKLDLIFRPWSRMFVNWALYRFKQKDKKFTESEKFFNHYEVDHDKFMMAMEKWQLDSNKMVDTRDFDWLISRTRASGHL